MNSKNTKTIISLLAFFILFTTSIWAQEVKDYATVIKSADEYYQNKDYYNAKASYQLAAKLNPEEAYPQEKVQEIINLLKAEMAVRGEYDGYIENADEAFDAKDYEIAITNYEKALALIAYEAHPKGRLEESKTLLEAAILKKSVYEQAITNADEHYAKQEYDQAISFYRDAANVDNAQKYPNDQILKITNILQNQDVNRQKYEQAVLKGDQQLNYQKFAEALSQYELALASKPADEYATSQVGKMKVFIEKEKEYDQITAAADKLYVDKDLAAAKAEYQKAIALLPEKTYAANMLSKMDAGLDKEQAKADKLEADYAKAISDGDQLFKDKKYQSAFSKYSRALDLKPNEQYPKTQLEEIDILLATGYVEVSCFVHEDNSGLFDARIQILENGNVKETAEIGTNGKHKFKLSLNSEYQAKFYKSDYVQKIISINTALPRDVNHNNIFECDIVIELFPDCATDLSILDRPVAEFSYRKNKGNFYVDEQRAQLVIDRVNELKEECKEIRAQQANKEEYDKIIAKADKSLEQKAYEKAIESYTAASLLIAEEQYPKDKLAEIQSVLEAADKYQALIIAGDAKYQAKDYENALYDYYAAKNLKPNEVYPQEKIDEIDALINAQKELDTNYIAALKIADDLYAIDSLSPALTAYEQALEIKLEEAYPKSQISEIERRLGAQKDLDKKYKDAIANADKLFEQEKLKDAKSAYLIASQIKPEEMYPKYKIEDINTIEEQRRIRAMDGDYADMLAQADAKFESLEYQAALGLYASASELKPKENYPSAQIEIINGLLIKLAADAEKYDVLIAQADQEFQAKEYAPSFDNYKLASLLKTEEAYPKEQMAIIEGIMKELSDLELVYQEEVRLGDEQFTASAWPVALIHFQKAEDLKPTEEYPKTKIAEINALMQGMADKDAAYAAAIAEGDTQFDKSEWAVALTSYQAASGIKAEEQYPKDRIAEINLKIKDQEVQQAAYDAIINEADALFGTQTYEDAKAKYQEALAILPSESYPQEKIAEIDGILANKEAAYAKAIADGDASFDVADWTPALGSYQTALGLKSAEQYPQDRIAEINLKIKDQVEQQATYDAIIVEGDALFGTQTYNDAKAKYQEALVILANESYPQEKIAEIDGILANKEAAYAKAIADGDASFDAIEWTAALGSYQTALGLKPAEQYPQDRIAEINQKIKDQAAQQAAYDAIIVAADGLFGTQTYNDAKAKYQEALAILPNESYPQEKIAEIDGILANKEAAYAKAIADGDASFDANEWTAALGSYQTALGLKPAEQYPKDRIAEINLKIKDQAEQQAAYDALIVEADALFGTQTYEDAKAKYQEALAILPNENYPQEKIAEIDGILANKEAAYAKAIADGDASFDAIEWTAALSSYQTALGLKPAEQYPQDRIAEINQKIKDQAAQQATYDALIVEADALFGTQTYNDAKAKYQEALAILANESYPQEKIAEIDGILANKEAAYVKAIADGDASFDATEWTAALGSYQTALGLKPAEQYPQDRIAEINLKIKDQAEQQATYDALIVEADALFGTQTYNDAKAKYQEALAILANESYPQEKIAEIDGILANKEAAYVKAISDGDASFDAVEWTAALSSYQTALGLKPAEQYPQDRIAEINQKLKDQEVQQATYDALIVEADALFGTQTYVDAKGKYQEALAIFATESHPQQRIAEIDGLLQGIADKDASYLAAISKADGYYGQSEWEMAKTAYENALEIKAEEEYPKTRIADINAKLEAIAAQKAQYDALIASADELFVAKTYVGSKAKYQEALTVLSSETYPTEQIAKIDALLQEMADQDALYVQLIQSADAALAGKSYEISLGQYKQASEMKTEETYPKEKIAEIEAILMQIAENDRLYSEAIAAADQNRDAASYDVAITKYEEASVLKAEESYPKEQILAIQNLLKSQAEQQAAYDAAIASADQKFEAKEWQASKVSYQEALGIKANEVYPQTQIQEIENTLAQIAEMEAAYAKAITDADAFYQSKSWQDALTNYTLASQIKIEEAYPKERISELNNLLGELAAQQAQYDALVAEADQLLGLKDYTASIGKYEAALEIKVNEEYPKTQLKSIEGILLKLAEQQKQYDVLIKEADKQFVKEEWSLALPKYQEALAIKVEEVYPQEQINIINGELQAIADLQAQYDAIILEADQLFTSLEYETALTKYEAASTLKAEEEYPKQKMKDIGDILAELARKNAEYDKVIAKADDLLQQESFAKSKEQYQEASLIFSDRTYPQEQIVKIDELVAKHEQYQVLVNTADGEFKERQYEASLGHFQEALVILPAKAYPAEKIIEIQSILDAMAATRAAYDAAVAQGDAQLAASEYDMAKQSFQTALGHLSTEVYPRQKIMEIDQILQDIARKRMAFDKVIAAGDAAFKEQGYDMALTKYQAALEILPEELYPQQKIAEINGILSQMADQQARFESLVAQGDQSFAAADYETSINLFTQAQAIYVHETYPPQKIEEARTALAKIQREQDVAYQKAIDKGDKGFRTRKWEPAKLAYQEASEIKTEELYPKEKLAEINAILKKELLSQQKEYDRYIADGERFYGTKYYQESILSFEKALTVFPFEKYPSEMIDKIFELIKKNSMVHILDGKMTIAQNHEEKFEFDPVSFKDRSENYILLEVKLSDPEQAVKLFVNFGKGGGQNGGYSIPLKNSDGYHSYFVSIGKQVKWVNQDNNYISLLPEGGSVEVKLIKISRNGI